MPAGRWTSAKPAWSRAPTQPSGRRASAPRIVRGRQADPAAIDEAVADEEAASLLGLDVGDTFTARFAAPDQLGDFFAYTGDPTKFPTEGPEVTFRVVGISAVFPTASSNYPEIQLTSAFHRELADEAAAIPLLGVYLEHGNADRAEFERDVERLAGGEDVGFRGEAEFVDQVQRGVHVQAGALWVLCGASPQSLRCCSSGRGLRDRPSRSRATTPPCGRSG